MCLAWGLPPHWVEGRTVRLELVTADGTRQGFALAQLVPPDVRREMDAFYRWRLTRANLRRQQQEFEARAAAGRR